MILVLNSLSFLEFKSFCIRRFSNRLNGICVKLERALEVERITNVELRKKVSGLREQRQVQ